MERLTKWNLKHIEWENFTSNDKKYIWRQESNRYKYVNK